MTAPCFSIALALLLAQIAVAKEQPEVTLRVEIGATLRMLVPDQGVEKPVYATLETESEQGRLILKEEEQKNKKVRVWSATKIKPVRFDEKDLNVRFTITKIQNQSEIRWTTSIEIQEGEPHDQRIPDLELSVPTLPGTRVSMQGKSIDIDQKKSLLPHVAMQVWEYQK